MRVSFIGFIFLIKRKHFNNPFFHNFSKGLFSLQNHMMMVTNKKLPGVVSYRLIAILMTVLFCYQQALPQDLFNLSQPKSGRSRAITSADPDPNSNADRIKYITPGETKVLADIPGAGIIKHIWLTFNEARPNWLEAGGSARPDEIVLRIYWDDSKEPAVESPLGDFFAAGFGGRYEIKSVTVQVEGGDGYNCYWAMPFYKHAVITVTNESKKNVRSFYYHIDYTEEKSLPEKTAYFCVQYKNEFPEKTGSDYLILNAEGEGQYVGTVMSVRSLFFDGLGNEPYTVSLLWLQLYEYRF
jgi:Protein of unknown function (DUF2961)